MDDKLQDSMDYFTHWYYEPPGDYDWACSWESSFVPREWHSKNNKYIFRVERNPMWVDGEDKYNEDNWVTSTH